MSDMERIAAEAAALSEQANNLLSEREDVRRWLGKSFDGASVNNYLAELDNLNGIIVRLTPELVSTLRALLPLAAPVGDAALAEARKRANVAYNLAGWDGDWETAADEAHKCIRLLERHTAQLQARLAAVEAELKRYTEPNL